MVMPKKADVRPPFTGASLKAWRERMGYSTEVASEQLGCSWQSIYNWENGQSDPPKYIGLACDALALGLGGDEKENTP